MWIRSELVTPASSEQISLIEAKAQCRVDLDFTRDDDYLTSLISIVREQAELICGRRFGSQAWELYFDQFQGAKLLGCGKVASALLYWRDAAGNWQALETEKYELLKSTPARFYYRNDFRDPEFGDYNERVKATVTCGEDAPKTVKQWMLLKIGTLYENRETESERVVSEHDFASSLLSIHKVMDYS